MSSPRTTPSTGGGGYGGGGYAGRNAPGLSIGDTGLCLHKMMHNIGIMDRIAGSVEEDSINVEKYVKELATAVREVTTAVGRMFEQEPWRITALITASGGGGGGPRQERRARGVMEHRVIQGLRAVNGDKTLFRQWRQKFVTAMGQVKEVYEEMIHNMVKDIDLGKDLENIMTPWRSVRRRMG